MDVTENACYWPLVFVYKPDGPKYDNCGPPHPLRGGVLLARKRDTQTKPEISLCNNKNNNNNNNNIYKLTRAKND